VLPRQPGDTCVGRRVWVLENYPVSRFTPTCVGTAQVMEASPEAVSIKKSVWDVIAHLMADLVCRGLEVYLKGQVKLYPWSILFRSNPFKRWGGGKVHLGQGLRAGAGVIPGESWVRICLNCDGVTGGWGLIWQRQGDSPSIKRTDSRWSRWAGYPVHRGTGEAIVPRPGWLNDRMTAANQAEPIDM